jgi:glutamyl-tRNA reductase
VQAELARLAARLGGNVEPRVVAELEQTVHRVVDKLLHTPTVRVKELAGEPGGSSYADALRALFDLDLDRVAAVSGTAPGAGQARVVVAEGPADPGTGAGTGGSGEGVTRSRATGLRAQGGAA